MILLRDQFAMNAIVYGVDQIGPSKHYTYRDGIRVYLTRDCPDCGGWGEHKFPGEGDFGTDGSAPCETCGGNGSLPEEDE